MAVTGQDTPAGRGTVALLTAAGVGAITDTPSGADALVRFDRPATAACLDALGPDPIVFNLNGTSDDAFERATVYASSLPSAPNQMNSAVAFPGIWKGALAVRATRINDAMLLAAAEAIAAVCRDESGGVSADLVVPSVISAHVVRDVAAAVQAAAEATGVGARRREHLSPDVRGRAAAVAAAATLAPQRPRHPDQRDRKHRHGHRAQHQDVQRGGC